MKTPSIETMNEIARQAKVLAEGAAKLHELHKMRTTMTATTFTVVQASIIAETQVAYGPEWDDTAAEHALLERANLPN